MYYDLGIEKMLEKTTIEIDSVVLDDLYNKYSSIVADKYVSPLFDEFTIKIVEKDIIREVTYNHFFEMDSKFIGLSEKDRWNKVDDFFAKNPNLSPDRIMLIYCKYHTATDWTLIYVNDDLKKKICKIGYHYDPIVKDGKQVVNYDTEFTIYANKDGEFDTEQENIDYIKSISNRVLLEFLTVSYYMENHSELVEYSKVEVSPLRKDITSVKKKNNTHKQNKGYYQKIKLKSKKKKYVISKETKIIHKTYNKVTPCWYVRGYYQHYGKDKILKFIPPRVNRRDKDKLDKPKAKTYEIKD